MTRLPLVILAAGRGSRFGGPKQIAPVGPSGELLCAYSAHDAARAGFGRILVVTGDQLAESIERSLRPVAEALGVALAIVVQPSPGGTAHAVRCAGAVLRGPFAVANGDDWYGPAAIRSLAVALSSPGDRHVLVTYPVQNTLSETGGVSRALCTLGGDGSLSGIEELREVRRIDGQVVGHRPDGTAVSLGAGDPVSMNLWGFRPSIIHHLDVRFAAFLRDRVAGSRNEFAVPTTIHALLQEAAIGVDVIMAGERPFGLTTQSDLPRIRTRLAQLVASGLYPPDLRSGRATFDTTPD